MVHSPFDDMTVVVDLPSELEPVVTVLPLPLPEWTVAELPLPPVVVEPLTCPPPAVTLLDMEELPAGGFSPGGNSTTLQPCCVLVVL
jgi:hypothetical protein